MKASRSEYTSVRGLRYHLRHWGEESAPTLLMLHGWMDVSASFQFVIEHLQHAWHVIAPDWRGFGLTDRSGADSYWFPDYLADLDFILDHCVGEQAVRLVGHSMGANIAMLYAGVRPDRVARLVNLEGFGLPPGEPEQAPRRYARWLDELRHPPVLSSYGSLAEVAARLRRMSPGLDDTSALYLAEQRATEGQDGRWHLLGDPVHRVTYPVLYRAQEVQACWQAIQAPVLWVEASETDLWRPYGDRACWRAEMDRRLTWIPDVRIARVSGAGHMLHHDQPAAVARLIEEFMLDG